MAVRQDVLPLSTALTLPAHEGRQALPCTSNLAAFAEPGGLRENKGKHTKNAPHTRERNAKAAKLPSIGGLRSDTPGPTDLLSKDQYARYQTVYAATDGDATSKHAAAWHEALEDG